MTTSPIEQAVLIAGVDEAGRGPLAGPVVAAAVILSPDDPIPGLDDSKKLKPAARERLASEIRSRALCWSLACAEPEEIDRLNILHATMAAMSRALDDLAIRPSAALIDGNRCPASVRHPLDMTAVVGGDALHSCISAASIIAKVHRDHLMTEMDRVFPVYGFAKHKGYPTAQHMQALREHGPTEQHRSSFRPVREAYERIKSAAVTAPASVLAGVGGGGRRSD